MISHVTSPPGFLPSHPRWAMVNPFVMKIYRMMESSATEYPAAIRWGSWRGHDTIVIKDQALLAKQVLPMFFKVKRQSLSLSVSQLPLSALASFVQAWKSRFFCSAVKHVLLSEDFERGRDGVLPRVLPGGASVSKDCPVRRTF